MRGFLFVTTALFTMCLAVWAYHQNYRTQAALREVRAVRAEIADLRETAGVLRAEWAYLNRPDRLADLADLNFKRLRLLPLMPDHFARIDQIAYPVEPAVPPEVPPHVLAAMRGSR